MQPCSEIGTATRTAWSKSSEISNVCGVCANDRMWSRFSGRNRPPSLMHRLRCARSSGRLNRGHRRRPRCRFTEASQCSLEDVDELLGLRGLLRIFRAPFPPVRPFVGELVLDPRHERRVAVRIDLPHALVRQEVPVILGPDRDSGSRWRAPLPLFDRAEGEVPAVRRDFRLFPEAVRIEPRVLPADGHPRIRLAFEFLDVVVGHGDRLEGRVLYVRPGEGCLKVRFERNGECQTAVPMPGPSPALRAPRRRCNACVIPRSTFGIPSNHAFASFAFAMSIAFAICASPSSARPRNRKAAPLYRRAYTAGQLMHPTKS